MNRDHQDQGLFIGGSWSPPSTDQVIEVTSPHTESVVASVPAAGRLTSTRPLPRPVSPSMTARGRGRHRPSDSTPCVG